MLWLGFGVTIGVVNRGCSALRGTDIQGDARKGQWSGSRPTGPP